MALGYRAAGQEQPELIFEPIGGVYEKAKTVSLSAGAGATIYYSLDGSFPSSASNRYKNPIVVNEVAVIRAVAYVGGVRSKVVTNTYVCDRKYDLPVISLATEPGNLWDFASGIYAEGCCADTIEPYLGANYWMSWEKAANIEMYDVEGVLCFNQGVGIGIFGGYSRMLPMKSIAVFAREKYGDNKLRYPIFSERDNNKYKSIILRNSGGDFLRTHIRDAFMTQLAKPTGVAIQAYEPAVVFINGKYWGIQNIREKISEHYLAQNFGVDKDNVDILRQNGVKRHGSSAEYKRLLAYLRNNSLVDDDKVEALRKFMDIEDFIRYNIAEVYSDNRDAGGNIRYWKERNDSAKWRWVFYDLDLGLGNNEPKGYMRNTLLKFTSVNSEQWPDPAWSTFIVRSLLANKKLEYQYINTFADHLNTVYHPDTANKLLDQMIARIDYEMSFHQKRWGSSYKNWKHHVGILRTFITLRPYYCRSHIMDRFGLNDTVNISVIHPGNNKCDLKFSSLDLKKNFTGVYFKNVPIQVEVIPKHDYEFVGWKDGDTQGAKRILKPNDDLVIEPILKPKKMSAQMDGVFFNEISFFSPEKDTSADWVELFNKTNNVVDISGWVFTDKTYKKGWSIPAGTTIQAKGFMVLTQDLLAFRTKYPSDTVLAVGDFGFGLSRKGELIKLYDQEGFLVDSINYELFTDEKIDTAYTIALSHPDSSHNNNYWLKERPSPSYQNQAYLDYLQEVQNKKYWTRVFYVGGGSFFFISVAGLLFYRYSKKKRSNNKDNR